VNNIKLLKILERIELDRPILMKDKLDVIWGDDEDLPPLFTNDNTKESISPKNSPRLKKEESLLISESLNNTNS